MLFKIFQKIVQILIKSSGTLGKYWKCWLLWKGTKIHVPVVLNFKNILIVQYLNTYKQVKLFLLGSIQFLILLTSYILPDLEINIVVILKLINLSKDLIIELKQFKFVLHVVSTTECWSVNLNTIFLVIIHVFNTSMSNVLLR